MSKETLQQEIAELQKQLEEKQKALAAMPEKWEPNGGWCVDVDGDKLKCDDGAFSWFGNCFRSREQVEKAAKAMRAHNRLLAWVSERAPSFEFNPESEPACIKVGDDGMFTAEINVWKRLGTVYMPFDVAFDLCRKLNSGEVEL